MGELLEISLQSLNGTIELTTSTDFLTIKPTRPVVTLLDTLKSLRKQEYEVYIPSILSWTMVSHSTKSNISGLLAPFDL